MSIQSLPASYTPIEIEQKTTTAAVKKWLHEHPVVQNTANIALALWGCSSCYAGIQNSSFYEVSLGCIAIGGAYLANKITPLFIPPTFNPCDKAFTPGVCREVTLTYDGNLPILCIPKETRPYDAGYARGYLMAAQIKELLVKTDFALHTVRGLPREIPNFIEQIKEKIPAEYLEEMEGLVAGYREKRATWKYLPGKELTINYLIYLHLLPDIKQIPLEGGKSWIERQQEDLMGCTVVIDNDPATGPRAIRTLDWIAMDIYGKYSLVELRETPEGLRYATQSFPFFVGTLTAMNEHGLCVALNAAKGWKDCPMGMPAVFYSRKMIETCTSVKRGNAAQTFWEEAYPLGPFNLSVLDEQHAAGVHFYQSENKGHRIRWWEGKELITLNFSYEGGREKNANNSRERKNEIETSYQEFRKGGYDRINSSERLRHLLNGPEVNNSGTICCAYLDPEHRTFEISFDNGYAGSRQLVKIPLDGWFSHQF